MRWSESAARAGYSDSCDTPTLPENADNRLKQQATELTAPIATPPGRSAARPGPRIPRRTLTPGTDGADRFGNRSRYWAACETGDAVAVETCVRRCTVTLES